MKILYHHRVRSKDGQFVHIEEMCVALRQRGHEVILVGPRAFEADEFGADAGGVAVLKRFLPMILYELIEFAYAFVAYARLRKAYLEHRPDAVYERYQLYMPAGVWLKKRYGAPLLLEVNSPLADERFRVNGLALKWLADWTEKATWRGASVVLPATAALSPYIRNAGVPDERIHVVRNAIRPENFVDFPDREEAKRRLGVEDKLVLGFTGFVREWHNMERVVEFMAGRGRDIDAHFLMVGDGPSRANIEAIARRLGVRDRLTVTGVVPRSEVPSYVAAFDIAFNIDNVPYALALKLFEYLAMGRAIIAPDSPNIREVLTDGKNAVLFDPEDPAAFDEALTMLCTDEKLRQRISEGARNTIEEKGLTWAQNAQRVEELILSFVRPGG
ncbi:MAG: glycosyltransferase family 4 protein [Rhodospirillales bacterium]|nr:glycosyltransferase family 4 protein [Rhodospirillales bacterium]